jgi:hypothetical protein
MKYGRINIITFLCILVVIGIPASVIAFINYPLGVAIFVFFFMVFGCILTIILFSKYVFSYIRIESDGIKWVYKNKTQYYFKWVDIKNIEIGTFLMSATFDLEFSSEIAILANMDKFQFNCNEEIRLYIVEHTNDPRIIEIFKNINLRY